MSLKDYAMNLAYELLGTQINKGKGEPTPEDIQGKTIEDIKLDDLRREKVRLEQEERKMLDRLRKLEAKKRALFEEGVRNPSEREQRVLARRIKELDVQANSMDSMLQAISKQMRILNGLIQVKERTRIMSESGFSKLLSEMDLGDLISYVDKASVEGEFHMNKFDDLINVLEEADNLSPEYREDQDVLQIMQAMQSAREAADSPEALDEKYAEFTRQMAEKEEEQDDDETFESFEEDF